MRAQLVRIVWTTNFDPLVADGCAKVYDGTGALTTVALDAPDLAAQAINQGRWPVEIKLHGDFRSRRLKNTSDELRHQDVQLRQLLVDACRRFGLVVVGYSGRDDSVMNTLQEALQHQGAFPMGLFWLHRGEDPPLPRVQELLRTAKAAGVEAALVRIENFDEIMRDLVRLGRDVDTVVLDTFSAARGRCSDAPRPSGSRGWPVVRLNALHVISIPNVCRRVVCQIGGFSEVREAVERAGVKVIYARRQAGVLAYGSDADVRKAFEPHGISEFDLYTIETRRLRYDSGERGLLREALTLAIARQCGLDSVRRRNTDLLAPSNPGDAIWAPLKRSVGALNGTVGGFSELQWREGIGTRLDWADDRLWLLFEPRVVFFGITDTNKAAATDFARERTVKRYNRQLNDLVEFWASRLVGNDLRALGVGDGVDAVFSISEVTGFSRRAGV